MNSPGIEPLIYRNESQKIDHWDSEKLIGLLPIITHDTVHIYVISLHVQYTTLQQMYNSYNSF